MQHNAYCCIAMTNYINTYVYACKIIMTTQRRATQFFRKMYLSLYWKGCVWEGVGDWTELQHIDPHTIGHNRISFPLSWAAQPGAWGPSLSGCWFSLPHHISNSSDPQLLNQGSRGPLLLGAVFSTGSFLQPVWSPTAQSGGPEGPFCRVLFSLQHHFSNSLIPNSSDLQLLNRGSRGPLLLGAVFSTASFSNSLELPVHRVI